MYLKMKDMNNENTTIKQEEITNEELKAEKTSDIPVEDLYAIDYGTIEFFAEEAEKSNMNISVVKISNGVLYYLDVNSIGTMNYISPCKENYKKIDTGVKRIKTLTLGSDTKNNYLIIKEDGTVKSLNIKKDGILYETYNPLAEYKVDDITNFDGETFSLKLLDGTNVTKKIENQNSEESGKEDNKITYKINNNKSPYGSKKYSEKGYYVDTLNQANAPYYYIISMGEKGSGGYSIEITDVKIDEKNNVNVTVKENSPQEDDIVTMAFTYPTCTLELSKYPNSITIKDEKGNEYEYVK